MNVFSTRNLLALGIIAVITVGAVLAYLYLAPRTYVIHRTAYGFEPRSLLIRAGDTVTFKSTTGEEFWPASGSHPTHQLYPEFDPKRPLAPNESWSFTFTRPGVWAFHDHLASKFQGSILVQGNPGESVKNCLESNAQGVKAGCYAAEVASLIETKGLDAAFAAFSKFYETDQVFRENCHDVMHIFGSKAYAVFQKTNEPVIRPETSYCAFGFYHGFIEEMFAEKGFSQLADGKAYCDLVGKTKDLPGGAQGARTAAAACYHGMGHASFDTIDGKLWGNDAAMVSYALSQCKRIASNDEQYRQCGSGVFNSLANAYSARSYDLAFNDVEPLKICSDQEKVQQVGCYKEIVLGQIRHQKLDFPSALSFIYRVPDAAIGAESLFGYIDDYIRYNRGNLSVADIPKLCLAQKGELYQKACIQGSISAFVGGGQPGREYEKPLELCSLIPSGTLHTYCVTFSFDILSTHYPIEKIRELCSSLPESDRQACTR